MTEGVHCQLKILPATIAALAFDGPLVSEVPSPPSTVVAMAMMLNGSWDGRGCELLCEPFVMCGHLELSWVSVDVSLCADLCAMSVGWCVCVCVCMCAGV